ncbi:hypothetical protein BVIR_1877 [Blastochloris viridis]|uniref:Mobile element protein n=1 Tax=Blastochloris viridis TaxID=1079 RepID=A0A0P0IF51_BLAVI|nr:hypothetical protein BVIR_1877 [Blastochloris viridis]CUU42314.1 hypothetical protein BVIRIDIS_13220 [Blastochloris viridis]
MIDRTHVLPIVQQARALGISRGSVYYAPRPVPAADLALAGLAEFPPVCHETVGAPGRGAWARMPTQKCYSPRLG